jgi:pyrroline-5-carboxylate reductase
MISKTIGFIGGGRVTRIILGGFKRSRTFPDHIIVQDTNVECLQKLKILFPGIKDTTIDLELPASRDIIFIALHPPIITKILNEISTYLKPDSIVISLAPVIGIAKLSESLNGFRRIVRMIPNAPSIINNGFNPVAFSNALSGAEKQSLINFFGALGKCPEVEEDKLEAYAILTAMGPTYYWFQLYELHEISKSFGLTDNEIEEGILNMVTGTVKTMYESELAPESVIDLIPVKPLADEEENIKSIYRSKLPSLYKRLKG